MPSRNAALGAVALALASMPAARAQSSDEIARKIEERLERTKDLRARFSQSYRSVALGREVRERGTFSLKRPGRMRWEYESPERKTFVCDGSSYYFYVPADRQVVVRDQKGAAGIAGLLLAGHGALTSFARELLEAPVGRTRLRLRPRATDPDVEEILLEADAELRIRSLEIVDIQGNLSRFEFDDVKENVGLEDELFRFEPPPGVEVIQG